MARSLSPISDKECAGIIHQFLISVLRLLSPLSYKSADRTIKCSQVKSCITSPLPYFFFFFKVGLTYFNFYLPESTPTRFDLQMLHDKMLKVVVWSGKSSTD